MKSRRTFAVAVAILLGLVLVVSWQLRSPATPAVAPLLQVSFVGRTNTPSGDPAIVMRVTNNSEQLQHFAFWAEVERAGVWVVADGWDDQHPGQLHWLSTHSASS